MAILQYGILKNCICEIGTLELNSLSECAAKVSLDQHRIIGLCQCNPGIIEFCLVTIRSFEIGQKKYCSGKICVLPGCILAICPGEITLINNGMIKYGATEIDSD